MLPWKQAYLTYKWVAYAGEGWESQAPIPPTNMRVILISERNDQIPTVYTYVVFTLHG